MKYVICLSFLLLSWCLIAQNLKRQAHWDFQFSQNDQSQFIIKSLVLGTITAKAGLKENDQVISINGSILSDAGSIGAIKGNIHAGDLVVFKIIRSGRHLSISFQASPKPMENLHGVETIYGEALTSFGYYTQTITTRPKSTHGKVPGIFFVSWLSCDPIEINKANMDGWAFLLQDIATKSGMAFMRAERAGLGDSQGPPCDQNDLKHDIASFKAAFRAFKRMEFVDSSQLFVFGASIGGALAPVLMQNENLKGIIVANTFSRTWFEHFIDFERTRLELSGKSFSEVNHSVKQFSELYSDYLLLSKTPGDIVQAKPYLKDLWYDEPGHQFGRPSNYHHQVQQLNVPGAWQKINYPVLVIYGEYDWIMGRQEHEYIIKIVNSNKLGNAELKMIPKMDHHFSVYKTPKEAFDAPYVNYSLDVFPLMLDWMKSRLK